MRGRWKVFLLNLLQLAATSCTGVIAATYVIATFTCGFCDTCYLAFMTGEKIELRAHEVDINPQYADSMEIETFTMHLSFETFTEADEGGLGTSSGRGKQ
jgi:hypothetical protein